MLDAHRKQRLTIVPGQHRVGEIDVRLLNHQDFEALGQIRPGLFQGENHQLASGVGDAFLVENPLREIGIVATRESCALMPITSMEEDRSSFTSEASAPTRFGNIMEIYRDGVPFSATSPLTLSYS